MIRAPEKGVYNGGESARLRHGQGDTVRARRRMSLAVRVTARQCHAAGLSPARGTVVSKSGGVLERDQVMARALHSPVY